MSAFVFNGRQEAAKLIPGLKEKVASLPKKLLLSVVLVGSDPINSGYLKQLQKVGRELTVPVLVKRFPSGTSFKKVAGFIQRENRSQRISGILLLVSPSAVLYPKREDLVNLVLLEKDFDGLGKNKKIIPSVCQAVLIAIKQAGEVLSFFPERVRVLVVGNRGFWGKRIEQTLKDQGFENVVGVDQETTDLVSETKRAKVLISCVGRPNLINKEMVKKGAAIIDVGFSLVNGQWTGDVNFAKVKDNAGFITPAPGGIGPLATVLILKNLIGKN